MRYIGTGQTTEVENLRYIGQLQKRKPSFKRKVEKHNYKYCDPVHGMI